MTTNNQKMPETIKEALLEERQSNQKTYSAVLEGVLEGLNDATNDPPIICAYELYVRLREMMENADMI